MARYKGWSRTPGKASQTPGPGATSTPQNQHDFLDTGPVSVGFTPINGRPVGGDSTWRLEAKPSRAHEKRGHDLIENDSAVGSKPKKSRTCKQQDIGIKTWPVTKQPAGNRRRSKTGALEEDHPNIEGKGREDSELSCVLSDTIQANFGQPMVDLYSLAAQDGPVDTELPNGAGQDAAGPTAVGSTVLDESSDDLYQGIDDQDLVQLSTQTDGDAEKACDECVDLRNEYEDLDEGFDDGLDDLDLVSLAERLTPGQKTSGTPKSVVTKLSWSPPKDYRPRQSANGRSSRLTPDQVMAVEQLSPRLASSPLASRTSTGLLSTPSMQADNSSPASPASLAPRHLVPFVDPPIHSPVANRSPIPGVSSHIRLITHFRVGPALKHAALAMRSFSSSQTVVELYARVLSSHRDGNKQMFELADLFHYDRPPYLNAEWIGWKGLPYFELDGAAFLEGGAGKKICRAIGKIEKNGRHGWRMCILSVWEASWDDIEAVKGIVCI